MIRKYVFKQQSRSIQQWKGWDGIINIGIQIIDLCENEVNSIYGELEGLLQEKQCYEFVHINH